MSDSMWLCCCQCGKQFEIFGELAEGTRAFYAAQPDHTPEKEGGVCDACFEQSKRDPSRQPVPKRRWFRFWHNHGDELTRIVIGEVQIAVGPFTIYKGRPWPAIAGAALTGLVVVALLAALLWKILA